MVIGDDKYGRLEHLYQTISVMSDAFVEGVEGDNVSQAGIFDHSVCLSVRYCSCASRSITLRTKTRL